MFPYPSGSGNRTPVDKESSSVQIAAPYIYRDFNMYVTGVWQKHYRCAVEIWNIEVKNG